eukprot:768165-Hanusia_phi.AAC.1
MAGEHPADEGERVGRLLLRADRIARQERNGGSRGRRRRRSGRRPGGGAWSEFCVILVCYNSHSGAGRRKEMHVDVTEEVESSEKRGGE